MSTPIDRFDPIPYAFTLAFRTGDVTVAMWHVGTMLTTLANPWTGNHATTLQQLAEDLRWSASRDYLRKILHRLRTDDWIEFESPGKNNEAVYMIHLTGLYRSRKTKRPRRRAVVGGGQRGSRKVPPREPGETVDDYGWRLARLLISPTEIEKVMLQIESDASLMLPGPEAGSSNGLRRISRDPV